MRSRGMAMDHRENSPPGGPADVKRQIVTACRVLEAAGQADMVWGHVSIRDPEGRVKVLHRMKDGKMELIEAP